MPATESRVTSNLQAEQEASRSHQKIGLLALVADSSTSHTSRRRG
jgi:hypothetical protein